MEPTQASVPPSPASVRLAAQIEQIVTKRLADDTLALPMLPAAAIKCLQLLKSEDFSTRALVAALQQDPVLSTRIMRVASSAAYAGSAAAETTLLAAIVRLGSQRTRSLVIECSAQQLFESRDKRIAGLFHELLDHSTAVALLARDLAAVNGQSAIAETAYLCGLLHDIGKVVVAALLLEAEKMVWQLRPMQAWVGSQAWMETITQTHRSVGVRLCAKWGLPAEIVEAVRGCADYDPVKRVSVGNFVRFANALAKSQGLCPGEVDNAAIQPMIMIGRSLLEIDQEVVDKVLHGLKERVQAKG